MFHCILFCIYMYIYIYHVHIQDRGQLPDFICKIFDKDSKGNYPSSKLKRTIINNLFVKRADGSFRMDLDNNIIVEARSQIERTEDARNERGMPRTVCFCARLRADADMIIDLD